MQIVCVWILNDLFSCKQQLQINANGNDAAMTGKRTVSEIKLIKGILEGPIDHSHWRNNACPFGCCFAHFMNITEVDCKWNSMHEFSTHKYYVILEERSTRKGAHSSADVQCCQIESVVVAAIEIRSLPSQSKVLRVEFFFRLWDIIISLFKPICIAVVFLFLMSLLKLYVVDVNFPIEYFSRCVICVYPGFLYRRKAHSSHKQTSERARSHWASFMPKKPI